MPDSQAAVANGGPPGGAHAPDSPQLRHHFADEEQQRDAANLGMWVFLATEVMFFGGMFCAYLIYRSWYFGDFGAASKSIECHIRRHQHRCPDLQQLDRRARGLGRANRSPHPSARQPYAHHASGLCFSWHQRQRVSRQVRGASRARRFLQLRKRAHTRDIPINMPTRSTPRFSSPSTSS